jgi:hypothetical protein
MFVFLSDFYFNLKSKKVFDSLFGDVNKVTKRIGSDIYVIEQAKFELGALYGGHNIHHQTTAAAEDGSNNLQT